MKKYWLDFSGSILIDAENADAAEEKFQDFIAEQWIKYCEINNVEERAEV